jgi:hypothetical protein
MAATTGTTKIKMRRIAPDRDDRTAAFGSDHIVSAGAKKHCNEGRNSTAQSSAERLLPRETQHALIAFFTGKSLFDEGIRV